MCRSRSSSISILHTLLPRLTGRIAALLKGDLLPDGGHRDGHRHDDGADQFHGSSRDVEAEGHRHDKTVEAAAEHDAQHTAHHRPLAETTWKNIIYQQQRGEIAIGSGGIFGNGLFSGRYYSVPNAHNDFILSWMGNVIGFVGLCIVLGALLALVIKTFATGARSESER